MNNDEFYVGYFPDAPKRTGSVIRKAVVITGMLVVGVSMFLAWSQKTFSTSNFEYGINTSGEGYLFTSPVPHLSVPLGELAGGEKLFQNILLVGSGKTGAEKVIDKIQSTAGKSLIGLKVKLNGYLIYGDGKAILQITEEDNDKLEVWDDIAISNHSESQTENLSLSGEVVDPKCYFGVMKPGEGKAHRACAIRCIAGGMPPVFRATGSAGYFLLVNENNEAINEDVLSIVGDQIKLTGEAVDWGDWRILKVNSKAIEAIARDKTKGEYLLAFNRGVTQCKRD